MKYGDLTLGQTEALMNKIGGMERMKRLLAGELVVVEAVTISWPTWKTVRLGTGLKTADDFRNAIKASGQKIGEWTNDILGKPAFTVANQEADVELVKATVRELTGKDLATYQEICQRAEERGWKKCPAEAGPQLRHQYSDQPYGEWLVIAMDPITDSGGRLKVFYVKHGYDGRCLFSLFGNPENVWHGGIVFVFCK